MKRHTWLGKTRLRTAFKPQHVQNKVVVWKLLEEKPQEQEAPGEGGTTVHPVFHYTDGAM